jgi:hypothetical protein
MSIVIPDPDPPPAAWLAPAEELLPLLPLPLLPLPLHAASTTEQAATQAIVSGLRALNLMHALP